MSIDNINVANKKILNNEIFSEIIFNCLNELEQKVKSLSIKDIKIKENIRSIKLKEKKVEEINQTILNKKEELKLLKELYNLKKEKKMNINDIMDSYLYFLISSNDIIDNKLNSLFQKEISINSKQKYINKILGQDEIENDYDYIYENIKKPIDISKFLIRPKNKNNKDINNINRITENGGDNLDGNIINEIDDTIKDNINNDNFKNNLYQNIKNKISSSSSYEKLSNGIKLEEIPLTISYKNSYKNVINNNKNKNNNINQLKIIHENKNNNKIRVNNNIISNNNSSNKKYEKFISQNNSKKMNEKKNNNNNINQNNPKNEENKDKEKNNFYIDKYNDEYLINNENANNKNMKVIKNFAKTDFGDYCGYNLKPNNKLKAEREIFKKLLNKKSNELYFAKDKNKNLKNFILNALNTKYFLRKILSIIFECSEIYNPHNKQTITETIHDSVFLSKINNNYEDSYDENEIENLNNIKIYEKCLDEFKKITQETKQLQDKINQFVCKISAIG